MGSLKKATLRVMLSIGGIKPSKQMETFRQIKNLTNRYGPLSPMLPTQAYRFTSDDKISYFEALTDSTGTFPEIGSS